MNKLSAKLVFYLSNAYFPHLSTGKCILSYKKFFESFGDADLSPKHPRPVKMPAPGIGAGKYNVKTIVAIRNSQNTLTSNGEDISIEEAAYRGIVITGL